MEKSLEFVRPEYDDLKGNCVAAKKDVKALGERLNFLSTQVVEMAILTLTVWSNTVIALMLNWSVCLRLLRQDVKCLLWT